MEVNAISTLVFSHKIFYRDGDKLRHVNVVEEEAQKALSAWGMWRPVPVPEAKVEGRPCRFMNPSKVDEIARIHRDY